MIAANTLARVESWEDHVEAWHHLGREVDGASWARAAVAASLKGRYGEDALGKFAKEVGFNKSSLYYIARTFEQFPEKSCRHENLTFTHHVDAVRLTDTPKQAREALATAEKDGLSANALRAYLRPAKALPEAVEAGQVTISAATKANTAWVMKPARGRGLKRVPREPEALAKFLVKQWQSAEVERLITARAAARGRPVTAPDRDLEPLHTTERMTVDEFLSSCVFDLTQPVDRFRAADLRRSLTGPGVCLNGHYYGRDVAAVEVRCVAPGIVEVTR